MPIDQKIKIQQALSKPEIKEKIRSTLKGRHVSIKTKEKMSVVRRGKHPNFNTKEKMSESAKKSWNKIETRQARSGSNSYQWKGGISFSPYCSKFNRKLKEEIKISFGYKCYLCPITQDEKRLGIHHIDYNKNTICNGKVWPLIPLCPKCHSKTNHNRWYWFNLLINYWVLKPEINFNTENFNVFF